GVSWGSGDRKGPGFWPRPFVRLPDVDAVGGRQIAPVAGPPVEGAVPGVDIADDAVHAPLRRAVRIGQHLLAQRVVADLVPPRLGVGEEEALVPGQAADHPGA